MKYHGSIKPYTERGISRVPCVKCGKPSKYQWGICSNKNRNLGVCPLCDIELNRIFLEFANFPNKQELLDAYKLKVIYDNQIYDYAEGQENLQRKSRKDA